MNVAERFGENLVRVRKLSRMSQDDLAERSTLNRTHIGLLEHGKRLPRLDTLVKLAAALEVSVNDLVQGIEWLPGENREGQFWDGGR